MVRFRPPTPNTLTKRNLQLILDRLQRLRNAPSHNKANPNRQFLETREISKVVKKISRDLTPSSRQDIERPVVLKGDMAVLSEDRRAAELFHEVYILVAAKSRCEAHIEVLNRGGVAFSENKSLFV